MNVRLNLLEDIFGLRRCNVLLAVCLLAAAPSANAVDRVWRNPDGGTFSNGGNWSNGVPGTSDVATFGLSIPGIFGALPPYTVSFIADATNQGLRVSDDRVTFDLNGHVYTTSDTSVAMQLGTVSSASGRLAVMDGIVILPFQSDLQIASTSGGSGLLAVAAGGLVIGSPKLTVGLNGNGTLNIFDNGDLIADQVTIGANIGSTGTANITGGGSSLLADVLIVGDFGTGSLSVTVGGRVDSTSGIVGNFGGGTGAVTVDGVGSRWDNAGALSVRRGTLNITAGGTVHAEFTIIGSGSGTGAVTVDGAGSLLDNISGILVGNIGHGTLSITNGGHVQSTESTIGDLSSGLVTVDGVGSQWQLGGSLTLGSDSQGTLEITAGGSVQSQSAVVGRNSNGTGMVTVDGDGSLWNNNAGAITVGDKGAGTLEITAGGTVQNQGALIGVDNNSTGLVTVDGDGSLWNNNAGAITVGDKGAGTLEITDGGKVITGSDASIGQQQSSTGTVIVSSTVATADSVWEIGGRLSLSLNADPLTSQGVGTVRIQPGGKVNVTEDTVVAGGDLLSLEGGTFTTSQISFQRFGSAGANFQWTSGTLHVGLFQGNLVNSAGILSPGSSIGATHIQGNYNQLTDAALEIEIGPVGQGAQNDSVSVTGAATIDGELTLSLINGADPLSSQTFIILDANTLVGSFDNIVSGQRLTTSDGLGSFLVQYGVGSAFDPNQIVLSAFEAIDLPGDYNNDDTVNVADYVVWRDHLGAAASLPNDSTPGVTAGDYIVWKHIFGAPAGNGSAANAHVPEPATLALLILGMLTIRWTCNRSTTIAW